MFAKKVTEEAFFEIENAARKVFFFPCLLFFFKKKREKLRCLLLRRKTKHNFYIYDVITWGKEK